MHEIFKKRHCVRKFQNKEIKKENLEEILNAANSAPSAGNLQARNILIIEDQKIKDRLVEASFNQNFVAEAPIVLVFFALPEKACKKYEDRGEKLFCIQDATISASFAWLQAVSVGLSACWVGGFDEESVKKVLDIKDNSKPIAIMPIGYEA